MKYYLGIDVETTGQFFNKNAMIALGCSIMDEQSNELETFTCFMSIPDDREWEQRCVDEFWSKQKTELYKIEKQMKDPKQEMIRFSEWIGAMDLKYGENLIIVSNFCAFDIAWVDYYLNIYVPEHYSIYYRLKSNENNIKTYSFRTPIINTNSAYIGALNLLEPNKTHECDLEQKLDIQNKKWINDHDALNDARNIVSNYILFLEKCKK